MVACEHLSLVQCDMVPSISCNRGTHFHLHATLHACMSHMEETNTIPIKIDEPTPQTRLQSKVPVLTDMPGSAASTAKDFTSETALFTYLR